jgi:hypothetical protein
MPNLGSSVWPEQSPLLSQAPFLVVGSRIQGCHTPVRILVFLSPCVVNKENELREAKHSENGIAEVELSGGDGFQNYFH